jgi:hypothetical protein
MMHRAVFCSNPTAHYTEQLIRGSVNRDLFEKWIPYARIVPNMLFRISKGAFWDISFQRFDKKCDFQAISRQCMD